MTILLDLNEFNLKFLKCWNGQIFISTICDNLIKLNQSAISSEGYDFNRKMSGRKLDLKQIVLDGAIDFIDSSFIRWVYYKGIKTNYMITNTGEVISMRKSIKKISKT